MDHADWLLATTTLQDQRTRGPLLTASCFIVYPVFAYQQQLSLVGLKLRASVTLRDATWERFYDTKYFAKRLSGFVIALNSSAFPLGSLKNIVHCSPG